MFRNSCFELAVLACVFAMLQGTAFADVSGSKVLEGLHVEQSEIDRLESGGIIAFSDEAYESTKRELSADAIILVDRDLSVVLKVLRENTTLIPAKLLIDHAEINSDDDFADIGFDETEFAEVENLFKARPGKKLNLSDAEFKALVNRLEPHRRGDRATKTVAASEAMREILINRYHKYKEQGLAGIEAYQRSSRKQIDIGRELLLSTETFKPFSGDFPDFYRIMESYPNGSDCCENYFRWLKVEIRKRPTFALAHTMVQVSEEYILLTERHFYLSNSLNSVQITMSWLPYDDNTYMGLAMSASADILTSLLGRTLRPLGRNKAKDLVTNVMQDIKAELEGEGDSSN